MASERPVRHAAPTQLVVTAGVPTQLIERAPTQPVKTHKDELIGKVVDGRFTVLQLLGVGGMDTVYKARQHSVDRDVALKVIREDMAHDEAAVKRFLREARAATRLTNPHTITVFDFGHSADGMVYIAME